jgi:hypothetical protein
MTTTRVAGRTNGPSPWKEFPVAVDLTGGLDVAREYVYASCPPEPGIKESVSMWISDDRGELGIPQVALEGMSPDWDSRVAKLTVGFPDGRLYRLREPGKPVPTEGPDGTSSVWGAGPLVFRCVEPFRRWTADFDGAAVETSTDAMKAADGASTGPRVDVEFHVECTMAAPAWEQGGLSAEMAALIQSSEEANIVDGRYEQLFRAEGTLKVRGTEHSFTGSGTRVRRRGVRPLHVFRGNILQSALFPSGRGFGCIVHAPRTDGIEAYNEGYLFEGDGELVPARVVKAPWMTEVKPIGNDVTVVLESRLGTTTIEGLTILSTCDLSGRPWIGPNFPKLICQAGVRYTWDGEVTYGMIENCIPTTEGADPSPAPIDPEQAWKAEEKLGAWTAG